ncbi:DUF975 family protein [Tissierella carlieri]|uniref:DUF975 family protein n=1 Tax=Tissierella carlieri TaxID=689904 RepID=A0ABT1SDR1_9FIRM|nr:DUF975 family protein [Tissierella carlieri]MBU5311332.1 DUF975 family protein [Tissierella carlieri]MCQ4924626.1 DUF975 family protein [Tissierella carlieri]
MWSRESIKNYAKDFLRKYYWKTFLVCLIVAIIGNSSGNGQVRLSTEYSQNQTINGVRNKIALESNNPVLNFTIRKLGRSPIFYISKGLIIAMIIFFIILLITVGYALEVGKNRFFLRGFKDDVSINNLFSTFNSNEYFGIVKTQFIRGLYNLLWTLLLIIPGIIKAYEYSMVPYILSEEPNLPSDEVISRSRRMTDGHKMDMFVLDLSFLGWYILGLFFFGIGGIFVNPYKEATMARLYNILSGNDSIDDIPILE